jgi:hypothetical protein
MKKRGASKKKKSRGPWLSGVMAVGIELARAMEPLTFFQMKVFNAQLAIMVDTKVPPN